jgi:hypothetical protein
MAGWKNYGVAEVYYFGVPLQKDQGACVIHVPHAETLHQLWLCVVRMMWRSWWRIRSTARAERWRVFCKPTLWLKWSFAVWRDGIYAGKSGRAWRLNGIGVWLGKESNTGHARMYARRRETGPEKLCAQTIFTFYGLRYTLHLCFNLHWTWGNIWGGNTLTMGKWMTTVTEYFDDIWQRHKANRKQEKKILWL